MELNNCFRSFICCCSYFHWAGKKTILFFNYILFILKVPPKVKNLICLPTRIRLLDKGVTCPTNCASCASDHKDFTHVFFSCPFAIQIWNRTGLWSSIQHALSITTSSTAAIFSLLENLSAELSQRLTTVMWSIWKHRNLRVWDDVTETSATVVERAWNMVIDWQLANTPAGLASNSQHQPPLSIEGGPSTLAPPNIRTWQPPLPGRYKCNIDAAFSSSLNRTGIGICVRDSTGTFVLAKVVPLPCVVSADVGEAFGLHSALQWLSDMQFDSVDFETDSKLSADAFLSDRNDTSEFGCIISSCRSLFTTLFSNSRVEFVRRQANEAAHALPREATLLASPAVYFEIPNCIEPMIINEML